MKIQNKILVVTGGASGIGRELVLKLLSRGAGVAAVDINKTALAELAELAGDRQNNLTTHVVNLTDRAAVEALPEQIIAQHGAVDGIINNAGIIQPFVRLNDLDYDAIERVMDVNLYGTLYMIKAFLPHLLKRPEAHIANVSSMGGFLPVPGQTIYGAAKAAVKLMTEGLNSELLHTSVRVTLVLPGATNTNIMANSGVTFKSEMASRQQMALMLTADKAAEQIIRGIEKDRYRVLVGMDTVFMDFMYRLSPKRAARLIFQQMKALL